MNISSLKQSTFLKRSDVGIGKLMTIKSVVQYNVAKEGAPEELKWCVEFNETDKPMVLNSTNGQIIAQITKSEETDDWVGHQVVLYDDPNVQYAGKLVGGIRVRAPRLKATAPKPAIAPAQQNQAPRPQQPRAAEQPQVYEPAEPEDSEVPF